MDGKSLSDAIEESLKEYTELYERATAVRLEFEYEKRKWEARVTGLLAQNQPSQNIKEKLVQFAEDDLYNKKTEDEDEVTIGRKRESYNSLHMKVSQNVSTDVQTDIPDRKKQKKFNPPTK